MNQKLILEYSEEEKNVPLLCVHISVTAFNLVQLKKCKNMALQLCYGLGGLMKKCD